MNMYAQPEPEFDAKPIGYFLKEFLKAASLNKKNTFPTLTKISNGLEKKAKPEFKVAVEAQKLCGVCKTPMNKGHVCNIKAPSVDPDYDVDKDPLDRYFRRRGY